MITYAYNDKMKENLNEIQGKGKIKIQRYKGLAK